MKSPRLRQGFGGRLAAEISGEIRPRFELGRKPGWCLGAASFKKQMLQEMEGKLGDHQAGELRRETAQAKSERIVAGELGRLGWAEKDLAQRPKSDPAKLALAARLRRETTLPLKAIMAQVRWGRPKAPTPACISGCNGPPLRQRKNTLSHEPKQTMLWVDPFSKGLIVKGGTSI